MPTAVRGPVRFRSSPCRPEGREATTSWDAPEPRIEVRISSDWAARAACHAVREVGATPVVGAPYAVPLPRPSAPAALVYDLSAWDPGAVAYLERRAREPEPIPILLYLPPTGAAFATLSGVPRSGYVGVQIQARDADSLSYLRAAAADLVQTIPRVRILQLLTEAVPMLSGVGLLFGQRALRVLGAGQRPNVASVARGLGLSMRTLQRRFQADGLPAPKAFLDWLTLLYVRTIAESGQATAVRVAARAGISSNDLYRMRKRVRCLDAPMAGLAVSSAERRHRHSPGPPVTSTPARAS